MVVRQRSEGHADLARGRSEESQNREDLLADYVGAHMSFNCPEYWEGGAENATQFEQVIRKCTPGLIEKVAKWDNSFLAPLWDDAVGIDVLRFLLTNEKLDLILLHLPELDAEQHETGALSIYSRKVLENDDELLGAALQKASSGTLVAVVSDHGFETVRYVVRPKVMLKAAGLADAVSVKFGLIWRRIPRRRRFCGSRSA